MSSISSSSTSSGGSITCGVTTPTSSALPGFDSVCGSPKGCRRSGTLNSQCSTGMIYSHNVSISNLWKTFYLSESGIIADISLGAEDCHENNSQINTHWPLEKSNSQHSNSSTKSNSTTPTQSNDTQVTIYHVPDVLPVNI